MFVLCMCEGKMRWYILLGTFCGGFVYVSAFSELIFKILRSFIEILKKLLWLLTRPLYILLAALWRSGRSFGNSAGRRIVEKRRLYRQRKADKNGVNKKEKTA